MAEEQDKKPEFELIRRAPPPEASGASPMALGLIAIVLVIVGVVFAVRGGGKDTGDGPASPTPSASLAPDEPAPDFVWEQIDFRIDQGDLRGALDAVEEALEDYPNARQLQAKRAELQRELRGDSGGANRPAALLVGDAKKAMAQGDFSAALDLLDAALEEDDDNAELYFLRGRCLGETGSKLEALSALQDAKDLGHDAAQVDQLIERYR